MAQHDARADRPTMRRVAPLVALLRDQRAAYLLVGGVNTVLGFSWFLLLHVTVGSTIGYMGTLVGAYVLGMFSGFVMQRRFVFRVTGPFLLDFVRFALVTSLTFAMNAALLPLFVEVFGVPVLPAQLLSIALTVVLSYFAHRSFSFRRVDAADALPAEYL